MPSSHAAATVSSAFDDPNLIAYGGLDGGAAGRAVRLAQAGRGERILVRVKGLGYPLCASSSVASVCWVAAHDAKSAKLSAVGVPAGAV